MSKIILAIDVGSSSIRCSAYRLLDDAPYRVEALEGCSVQKRWRSVRPTLGQIALHGSDDNALSLLDEIDASIDEILQVLHVKMSETFLIVGLGFSTFVMNLVAVDVDGELVGEEATLSYACNTQEVASECRSIRSDYSSGQLTNLYQSTGAPLHSAYALAQLRALYRERPELSQRIHKWQTLASVCLSRWCGRAVSPISYSEASWTGLLNFRRCEWDADALVLLPEECRQALPELVDYSEAFIGLPVKKEGNQNEENLYWSRWPNLREACHFFSGLGDGACANIGSKCSTSSRIAVTIGTSAAARVVLPLSKSSSTAAILNEPASFIVPSGLWCYRLDKSYVVLGGALTDGGSVVEWAREFLNLRDAEAFADCMKQVQDMMTVSVKDKEQESSHSTNLTVIPFLSGERSTGYRDGANGCVMGLTRETTPAMFLKACLESVMLRVNAVVQLVKGCIAMANGEKGPHLIVSGAALERNQHWRQMLADATGMEVYLDNDSQEGTSRGVARMVAVALAMQAEGESRTSTPFLDEEGIMSPTVSKPSVQATDGYWAIAAKDQKEFIDTVSPLW